MTKSYRIKRIAQHPAFIPRAANWFHEKWNVPVEAYLESMKESLGQDCGVPQWYLALDQERIIGGIGVIENDFHVRKDLTPNICALYVEAEYRCQGVAGALLDFVCQDMKGKGISTLYLITDHTSFYERYGWKFLCMVQEEDSEAFTRMYVHQMTV